MGHEIKEITRFWNQPDVVSAFRDSSLQDYWVEHFSTIPDRADKRVLDLGCGGGRYTEMLVKMGYQVTSIDLHEGMLEATGARLGDRRSEVNLIRASIVDIPVATQVFDIVLANGVLHNAPTVPDFERSCAEVARIMKPDATLCLNVFFDNGLNTNIEKVGRRLFTTRDELPMVLYEGNDLTALWAQNKLAPEGEVVTYTRSLDVGDRAVYRGVFRKQG